jgi:CheY-like chemotaxis protein
MKDFRETKNKPTRYRVLLVDDHEPLAEATAEFLRANGLDVRIASTGGEALEMAAAFDADIVLCDISLPDMSGFEVARVLRGLPWTKDAVIALHTAMTETDIRSLAQHRDPAVNMYLSKPITAEKVDAVIAKLPSAVRKELGDVKIRKSRREKLRQKPA